MKIRRVFVFGIVLGILLIGMVSAGFGDFWGRITGKFAHTECGDGLLEGDEICDSEVYNCKTGDNYKGKNSCLSDCSAFTGCVTSEKCGDGIVNGNERCDDKNIGSGDGCSASCKRETGWVCSGEPSVCSREDPYQYCGEGIITGTEECDDFCDRYGGVCSNGDGCSVDCKVESGWECSGEPSYCWELPKECTDEKDNDGDGKFDFPDDPGCESAEDNDETDEIRRVNMELSVATIRDIYKTNEKILLTDPPEKNEIEEIEIGVFEEDDNSEIREGYIVELKAEPFLLKKTEFEEEIENKREAEGRRLAAVNFIIDIFVDDSDDLKRKLPGKLDNYEGEIKKEHNNVIRDIREEVIEVGGIAGKVVDRGGEFELLGEFTDVFNGIALNVSQEEIDKIEKLDGVLKVYPNYEISSHLSESVSQIKADRVWDSVRDSSGRAVTGEGVKIAVIDTGVDYEHEDLGGCYVNEGREPEITELPENCNAIKYSGSFGDHINLVFVPSDFNGDLEKFEIEIRRIYSDFERYPLLSSDIERLNVLYVTKEARNSFCDFDTTNDRLILCDVREAFKLSDECTLDDVETIIVHNDDRYGGAGYIGAPVTSIHEDSPIIAVHEIGHSLYNLGDEYNNGFHDYVTSPNCDQEGCSKWNDLRGWEGVNCKANKCKDSFSSEDTIMYKLRYKFEEVNERISCCVYNVKTGEFPSYCSRFENQGRGLENYCEEEIYGRYGIAQLPNRYDFSLIDGEWKLESVVRLKSNNYYNEDFEGDEDGEILIELELDDGAVIKIKKDDKERVEYFLEDGTPRNEFVERNYFTFLVDEGAGEVQSVSVNGIEIAGNEEIQSLRINSSPSKIRRLLPKDGSDIDRCIAIGGIYYVDEKGRRIDFDSMNELASGRKNERLKVNIDLDVESHLSESVSQIKANRVWDSVRDSTGRAVTGEGVKIAVIDTGVDYEHEDLGGCYVSEESEPEKVNTPEKCEELKFSGVFEDHINIVFVPSDYDGDLDSFKEDAEKAYEFFENFNPLKSKNEKLNAFYVTKEASSSYCANSNPDAGLSGIMKCRRIGEAVKLANTCYGGDKAIVILHNEVGRGVAYPGIAAVVPIKYRFEGTAVHELGHSLFELGDEYHAFSDYFDSPNCDQEGCSKWDDILGWRGVNCRSNMCVDSYASERTLMESSRSGLNFEEVNERITCCVYNVKTGEFPGYCDDYLDQGDGLEKYCEEEIYGQYGIAQLPNRYDFSLIDGEWKLESVIRLKSNNYFNEDFEGDEDGELVVDLELDDGSIKEIRRNKLERIEYSLDDGNFRNDFEERNYFSVLIDEGDGDVQKVSVNGIEVADSEEIKSLRIDSSPNRVARLSPGDGSESEECKVIGGYDFVNGDDYPMDDNGHGTHVAGIAAGNGFIKGVAPDAKIMAYKILDQNGKGNSLDMLNAVERAVSDGADVISLSLGCESYGCNPDYAMSKIVDNAVESGIIVVASAGNTGMKGINTINSPGNSRKVISVGASCGSDLREGGCDGGVTSFSSRGQVIWGGGKTITKPDVVAPGLSVCSIQAKRDKIWKETFEKTRENIHCMDSLKHISLSGSSMAAAHIAGLAALIKQKNPEIDVESVRHLLKNTASPYSDVIKLDGESPERYGDYIAQGKGLVDSEKAINLDGGPPAVFLELSDPVFKDNVRDVKYSISENDGNWKLEYGLGLDPGSWIELNSGNGNDEGIVKSVDFSDVGDESPVSFRLRAENNRRQISEEKVIDYGFASLERGWPYMINNEKVSEMFSLDLNGDGNKEIIITTSSGEVESKGQVIVKNVNGEDLPGWPKRLSERNIRLAFGDLDNDGDIEIVASQLKTGIIHAWKIDGRELTGWPVKLNSEISGYPTIWEIDNDGELEVIVVTPIPARNIAKINIIGINGRIEKIIDGPPGYVTAGERTSPIVGDIDNDGFSEIGYAYNKEGQNNLLVFYNHDGSEVDDWTDFSFIGGSSNPVLLDLNKDGDLEIIVNSKIGILELDEAGILRNIFRGNKAENENYWIYGSDPISVYKKKKRDGIRISSLCDSNRFPGFFADLNSEENGVLIQHCSSGKLKKYEMSNFGEKEIMSTMSGTKSRGFLDDIDGDGILEFITSDDRTRLVYIFDLSFMGEIGQKFLFFDERNSGCFGCLDKLNKPQSKIVNSGSTEEVVLEMSVRKLDGTYSIIIFEEKLTIPSGETVKLDKIFNNLDVEMSNSGEYELYVLIKDENGNLLEDLNGNSLKERWKFNVV